MYLAVCFSRSAITVEEDMYPSIFPPYISK